MVCLPLLQQCSFVIIIPTVHSLTSSASQFWALISPLRHTSQPPRLAPTSPLRIFFEKHGVTVARHPVLFIVLSVAFSVILSYPTLFLYFNDTPGPASVTHHVWTSVTPFLYPSAVPNIGIKQAWIQGSYMEVLTQDVLKEGLRVQQALLPDAICSSAPAGDYYSDADLDNQMMGEAENRPIMFFHSPLLYWNCSLETIEQDRRILKTVNENNARRSTAGITLRWGSVFAGKQFSHQKLIAADALVISMFYDLNSTAGELWDQRATKLAREAEEHGRYKVFPSDGREGYSSLYEVNSFARESMQVVAILTIFSFSSFASSQSLFLTFSPCPLATCLPRHIWPYHCVGSGP